MLKLEFNALIAMFHFCLNFHAFNKFILLTSLLGRQAKTFFVCKTEISALLKDILLALGKIGLKFSKECLSFVLQQLHYFTKIVPLT